MIKFSFLIVLLTLISMVQWNKSRVQHNSNWKNYLLISKKNHYHLLPNNPENIPTTSGNMENLRRSKKYSTFNSNIQSNYGKKSPQAEFPSSVVPSSLETRNVGFSNNTFVKESRDVQKYPENIFWNENENYPKKEIEEFFNSSEYLKFSSFFGDVKADYLKTRMDDTSTYFSFCKSESHYENPKKAVNRKNQVVFIVQGDNPDKEQGYIAEKCLTNNQNEHVNQTCAFSNNLPLNIRGTCEQMYVYKKMVTVDIDLHNPKGPTFKGFYVDNFKIAYCCMCMTTKKF